MLAIKFFCNNGRVVKKSVSFNYWELVISFGQIKPNYMLLTSRKTLPWPSLIMGYIPFTSQINLKNTLDELWLQALRIQLVETLNKQHKTEWCFIGSMPFLWSLKHIDVYAIFAMHNFVMSLQFDNDSMEWPKHDSILMLLISILLLWKLTSSEMVVN